MIKCLRRQIPIGPLFMIWTALNFAAVSIVLVSSAVAKDESRITLDQATREKCLDVLRRGMKGDEFWPAIHAAEGLTLGGKAPEVIEFLKPKLMTETDDQKRCGIAREIARAGDRSTVSVLLNILSGENPHGHVHAAESLYKIFEVGDGVAIRNAYSQTDKPTLRMMAAGALVRSGDASALTAIRNLLLHDDPKIFPIAGWIVGQVGESSDIPRLKSLLNRCPDDVTRAFVQHALAMLGDAEGIEALVKNLSSSDGPVRTYAANFAGDARIIRTVERLKEMLDDPVADARYRAAQSLLVLASPAPLAFRTEAKAAYQELSPKYCWFHPRVAPLPGYGTNGGLAVVMTIQKHLAADDHYSGMYFLRTNDLGKTWTGPTEIPELAWKQGDNNETIAVCDVTPGWLSHHKKLLAIGTKLRYSQAGAQLLDKPKSHECAYCTYDPETNRWTSWKML
ncbi:MAG: HEAT repeat domain-containing protein, partial [Planctomycetes bacterium]|nr:HEAT repeat domain-containing protein [Planctomycetota bacterium]